MSIPTQNTTQVTEPNKVISMTVPTGSSSISDTGVIKMTVPKYNVYEFF